MDKKKLIIIGTGDAGLNALSKSLMHTHDHIVIDRPPENSFELNGIRYIPIEKENSTKKSKSELIAMMIHYMSVPFSIPYGGSNNYERKLPRGTNIIQEYGLIQLKKSKLSKWERNEVEFIFESNFKKYEKD